jgi:hypothetical protein
MKTLTFAAFQLLTLYVGYESGMPYTDNMLLKFRGSKKAKLTQQPIELKRKKAS